MSDNRITELSPERATPEEMAGRLMESEHRSRYVWAAQLADGRDVLDAGCGTGYGTEILASGGARRAVGIDIAQDAIEYARSSSAGESGEFVLGNLHELPFDDRAFELAVCFEVIEHVDQQQQAISELRRVLHPSGLLAISSPNRDVYPPGNPHHVHEFTPEELEGALRNEFANVRLYRQSPWLAATVLDDTQSRLAGLEAPLTLRAIKLRSVKPGEEVFTIALASDGELPTPDALTIMGEPFEVRWWEAQRDGAIAERDRERDMRSTELSEWDRERDAYSRDRESYEQERRERGRALLELETEFAQALHKISELHIKEDELKEWANEQIRIRENLLQDLGDYQNRLARAERTIDDITGSLSWSITSPLRMIKRSFSKR